MRRMSNTDVLAGSRPPESMKSKVRSIFALIASLAYSSGNASAIEGNIPFEACCGDPPAVALDDAADTSGIRPPL